MGLSGGGRGKKGRRVPSPHVGPEEHFLLFNPITPPPSETRPFASDGHRGSYSGSESPHSCVPRNKASKLFFESQRATPQGTPSLLGLDAQDRGTEVFLPCDQQSTAFRDTWGRRLAGELGRLSALHAGFASET